jgi:hypothetical protein
MGTSILECNEIWFYITKEILAASFLELTVREPKEKIESKDN